ncbi:MAG: DUF378 domain-containing protein [Planctomycetota bacterium]|jgi:uncharacterized membrane protein YuzA (DUF378 family)
MSKAEKFKLIDIVSSVLLIVGGINWGLVGLFNINLVGSIFGYETFLSRLIYALVGAAAIYDLVQMKAIIRRWNIHYHEPVST